MCVFSEEEEDEDTTAPPPVEEAHDEKDEQNEQQEEGKNRNATLENSQTRAGGFFVLRILLFSPVDTSKELTEEEKLQVLHSEEFLSFFERGSRIVERALAEQVDVCFDYSGRDLEDKEG